MILPDNCKVFLYRQPMDMRCGFERLSGTVKQAFDMDPTCGHLFLFLNKRANRTKILYWDKDGWAIWYKRLEQGRFVLPAENNSGHISATELAMLLYGVDMRSVVRTKRFAL